MASANLHAPQSPGQQGAEDIYDEHGYDEDVEHVEEQPLGDGLQPLGDGLGDGTNTVPEEVQQNVASTQSGSTDPFEQDEVLSSRANRRDRTMEWCSKSTLAFVEQVEHRTAFEKWAAYKQSNFESEINRGKKRPFDTADMPVALMDAMYVNQPSRAKQLKLADDKRSTEGGVISRALYPLTKAYDLVRDVRSKAGDDAVIQEQLLEVQKNLADGVLFTRNAAQFISHKRQKAIAAVFRPEYQSLADTSSSKTKLFDTDDKDQPQTLIWQKIVGKPSAAAGGSFRRSFRGRGGTGARGHGGGGLSFRGGFSSGRGAPRGRGGGFRGGNKR